MKDKPKDDGNIRVVRVVDFVAWMRDNGLVRKHGRVLWIAAQKRREEFERIWPPQVSS